MKNMKVISVCIFASMTIGCGSTSVAPVLPRVPAIEYSKHISRHVSQVNNTYPKASLRFVKDLPPEERAREQQLHRTHSHPDIVIPNNKEDFTSYSAPQQKGGEYKSPLALGDPGVSSSLWQESRRGNEIFRDDRAWQPMDLITIVVSESSEGKKEADTEVKHKSTIAAAIESLLGFEVEASNANPNLDPTSLITASTTNDFKGEGETTRKGSLTAKISAMVVEVLPSGILRVEGEKIISVNSEEQVMVISGLVRPRDISSDNEIVSAKIANMRIDYFGKGTLGEAQSGGWGSRLIRVIWPF